MCVGGGGGGRGLFGTHDMQTESEPKGEMVRCGSREEGRGGGGR